MILLPRIHIPHYTRRSSRNYPVGWTNRVGIPIVADGGHGEVCGGDEDRGHVPTKGD